MQSNHLKTLLLAFLVTFIVADDTFCSKKWKMVAVGMNHTLGLMANGSLYSWGCGDVGQLGYSTGYYPCQWTPRQVSLQATFDMMQGKETFKFIAAGAFSSYAITTAGDIRSWGQNNRGQLGNGNSQGSNWAPFRVGDYKDWDYIAAGYEHVLALRNNGTLYGWGSGDFGQILKEEKRAYEKPVQIGKDKAIKYISAGPSSSFAIALDGKLYAWGSNSNGALGDGSIINRNLGVHIGGSTRFSMVSAGFRHTLAIDTNGSLWAWGDNEHGQIALPETDRNSLIPVIPEALKNSKWKAVYAGTYYSLAIDANDTLWAFGSNSIGQLGMSESDNGQLKSPCLKKRCPPGHVLSGQKWSNISAGTYHTFGITSEGALIGWGLNEGGLLGNGTELGEWNANPPQLCRNRKPKVITKLLNWLTKKGQKLL